MGTYSERIRKATTQGQIYTVLTAAAYDTQISVDEYDALQAMADFFAERLTVKGVMEWTA